MSKYKRSLWSALPMFLFLVGTLAFNLSVVPGHHAQGDGAIALSSEVAYSTNCPDMINSMDGGASAGNCDLAPIATGDLANVESHVIANTATIGHRDAQNQEKVVTTQGWESVLELTCKEQGSCPEDLPPTIIRVQAKNLTELNAKITAAYKKQIDIATTEVKRAKERKAKEDAAAKALKKDIENCVVDEDTPTVKNTAAERTSCQLTTLKSIKDPDEAAEYFETNLQENLKKWASSSNPALRAKAKKMLDDLTTSFGSKDGAEALLADLSEIPKYAADKLAEDQMKLQIKGLPAGKQRDNLLAELRLKQSLYSGTFVDDKASIPTSDWAATSLSDFQRNMDEYIADLKGIGSNASKQLATTYPVGSNPYPDPVGVTANGPTPNFAPGNTIATGLQSAPPAPTAVPHPSGRH